MLFFLFSLLSAAQPPEIQKIYVAPPTIHDEVLQPYQRYLNSLLLSSAHTNDHWVKRSGRADDVRLYDTHTIEYALDTTCNYHYPLRCGNENVHWVMITDIFTTEHFATIIVKLYDENTQLIASASKSSYSIEKCKKPIRNTTVKQETPYGQSKTEIKEELPEKCITFKPSVLDKDIKQTVSILFASIHPL